MTRGLLPQSVLDEIDSRLPDVLSVRAMLAGLLPDFCSMIFKPLDHAPVALVCFDDWTETMVAIRLALFEFIANGSYYREHKEPPQPVEAVYLERYFLDDAAVRLYSAGEHLAYAIMFMKGLSLSDVAAERPNRTSVAAAIAAYLQKHEQRNALSSAVETLGKSRDWRFTVAYRNRWVHEQPPTVRGLGLIYRRRLRWIVSPDGARTCLPIKAGDEPEYEISDIAGHILGANEKIIATAEIAAREYLTILEHKGIKKADGIWHVALRH